MEDKTPFWLNPRWLANTLATVTVPSVPMVEAILAKSLSMKNLTVEETAALMSVEDPGLRQRIRNTASQVARRAYGDRIVLTAPLHLTNICTSECTYCPCRVGNTAVERKRLSMDEIRAATLRLVREGHKRVVIAVAHVTADDIAYIASAVEAVMSVHEGCGEIRSVNLKVEGLDEADFRHLKDLWDVNVVISMQETYDEQSYRATHLSGPKADFARHLAIPDAIFDAGLKDVGFGLLLGLGPWKFDLLAMIQHSEHLLKTYGTIPHTVNLTRLCRVPGSLLWPAPHPLTDEEYLDCVALTRLAIPNTGIIVSTREPGGLWRDACNVGASQVYTGSLANPYESWSEVPGQQVPFPTVEDCHIEETVRYLVEEAHRMPSFCTACPRLGRSGKEFMEMVQNCGMSSQCWPNSVASLLEFLLHYATPRTRQLGEALIDEKLKSMNEAERTLADRLMRQVRNGRLDEFV